MSNHEANLDHFMNRGYLLNLKLRGMQSAAAVFNSAINLARYWQNPKIKYLFQLSKYFTFTATLNIGPKQTCIALI